jgi:peptide methionine sulfoxide reductase MsrA
LRFIPVDRLAAEGYAAYLPRFGAGAESSLPAATANACAAPKPGERAGCEATLDTAVLAGGHDTKAALEQVPGVLEAESGTAERTDAVRVVFDPKRVAYADLLEKWAATVARDKSRARVVFVTSDEQRDAVEQWKAHASSGAGRASGVVVREADVGTFTAASR